MKNQYQYFYLFIFFISSFFSQAQAPVNWTQGYGVQCCDGMPYLVHFPLIRDMHIAPNGNIYVLNWHYTNTIMQPSLAEDFEIKKFSPSGSLLQSYQHVRGSFAYRDKGSKIVVDGNNNIFVAGTEKNNNENKTRAFLYKFNSSLTLLWSKPTDSVSGSSSSIEIVNLLLDPSGKLRLVSNTIDSLSTGFKRKIVNQKISASGTINYTKKFVFGNSAYAKEAMLDNSSNLVICGSGHYSSSGDNYILLKYGPSGALVFSKTSLSINGQIFISSLNSMVIDSVNNIYVAGGTYLNPGPSSICLVKYDSTGVKKWIKTTPTTYDGYGMRVGLTNFNTVSVVAIVQDSSSGIVYAKILKYQSSGTLVSNNILNNLGSINEARFNNGNLYITGRYINDLHTTCFDNSGNILWTDNYAYGFSGTNHGTHLTFGPNNTLVCGGYNFNIVTSIHSESTIIRKLSPVLREAVNLLPPNINLIVYPNPASHQVNIELKGFKEFATNCEIAIFNYLGKKIFSSALKSNNSIMHFNIDGWQNGIYFVRVINSEGLPINEKFEVIGK